ncbi:protein gp37 [Elusimicrobium simillimum]|uniref:DUF5131 family protein n=1 Tax=Elusimicrobium simillimum TaxID=3143438 RepID=UPI003C6FA250
MTTWNPWHGCQKLSEGCKNCYVYRIDAYHGKDASVVAKTQMFNLPVKRTRSREYKVLSGTLVYTCFTSDFFLPQADQWRKEAWEMIKIRRDLQFFMITKRIDRLHVNLPADWGDGYDNVTIACTVENQQMADYRIPIYRAAPIKTKVLVCAPLLGPIDLRPYLGDWLEEVSVGGESGKRARTCNFEWVLDIRQQCVDAGIPFGFRQTGTSFLKDGKTYTIPKKLEHIQAKKAGIDFE